VFEYSIRILKEDLIRKRLSEFPNYEEIKDLNDSIELLCMGEEIEG